MRITIKDDAHKNRKGFEVTNTQLTIGELADSYAESRGLDLSRRYTLKDEGALKANAYRMITTVEAAGFSEGDRFDLVATDLVRDNPPAPETRAVRKKSTRGRAKKTTARRGGRPAGPRKTAARSRNGGGSGELAETLSQAASRIEGLESVLETAKRVHAELGDAIEAIEGAA